MAIKVIVELQAKPGKRAALKNLLESVAATHGPGTAGFLGSTRYEVLDNPDMLVEIADWESAEVRAAAMQEAMANRSLCTSVGDCWPRHSGPRSSGSCPDGRAASPSAPGAPPRGERSLASAWSRQCRGIMELMSL